MKPWLDHPNRRPPHPRKPPKRILRIRPAKLNISFRPARFGLKPEIKIE